MNLKRLMAPGQHLSTIRRRAFTFSTRASKPRPVLKAAEEPPVTAKQEHSKPTLVFTPEELDEIFDPKFVKKIFQQSS